MAVGIVVVSHSRALAEAAVALADIMVHDDRPPVAVAAGLDDGGFGTDPTAIMAAIEEVRPQADGVVLFTDMGSAIMGAETAVDMLAADDVRILAAPFVEGLTAGLTAAAGGGTVDEVARAAESALDAKLVQLGREPQAAVDEAPAADDARTADVVLVNEVGLHARPASKLASLAGRYEADVQVSVEGKAPVNAKSTMSLMALGATRGTSLHVEATGPEADEALRAIVEFVETGLGD